MEWTRSRDDEAVTEWDREDDHATVRLRERPDGSYAVRLDVLEQAADGDRYDHGIAASREAAVELVADWTDGGVRAAGDEVGGDDGDDEVGMDDRDDEVGTDAGNGS